MANSANPPKDGDGYFSTLSRELRDIIWNAVIDRTDYGHRGSALTLNKKLCAEFRESLDESMISLRPTISYDSNRYTLVQVMQGGIFSSPPWTIKFPDLEALTRLESKSVRKVILHASTSPETTMSELDPVLEYYVLAAPKLMEAMSNFLMKSCVPLLPNLTTVKIRLSDAVRRPDWTHPRYMTPWQRYISERTFHPQRHIHRRLLPGVRAIFNGCRIDKLEFVDYVPRKDPAAHFQKLRKDMQGAIGCRGRLSTYDVTVYGSKPDDSGVWRGEQLVKLSLT